MTKNLSEKIKELGMFAKQTGAGPGGAPDTLLGPWHGAERD